MLCLRIQAHAVVAKPERKGVLSVGNLRLYRVGVRMADGVTECLSSNSIDLVLCERREFAPRSLDDDAVGGCAPPLFGATLLAECPEGLLKIASDRHGRAQTAHRVATFGNGLIALFKGHLKCPVRVVRALGQHVTHRLKSV